MRIATIVMFMVILGTTSSMAGPKEWGRNALDTGAKARRATESFFSEAGSLIGHAFMETGGKTGHAFSVLGCGTGRTFMKTGETLGKFFGFSGVCVGRSARTFGRTIAGLFSSPGS